MNHLNKKDFVIIGSKDESFDEPYQYTQIRNPIRIFFKNKLAVTSLIILLIIIAIVIFGPLFNNYQYDKEDLYAHNFKPSLEHWFGTDTVGRDIFIRVCLGGRISLLVGVVVATINLIIGIIYGGICAYYGGIVDDIIMRIVEIILCVPNLIIILLIYMILIPSITGLIIAMSLTGWCTVTRIVRAQLLQLKEQDYILAAHALGATSARIISKHLIGNLINTAIVVISLEIPSVMLNEATLSYLGFGVQPPDLSWGLVANQSQFAFIFYPYQTFIPVTFIAITIICFNFIGEGLQNVFDPTFLN
ncbi:ABC transporter permease [Clostridium estertheticum]|uniref:ABC transporter permease n=1 Tax=Clostridium estertheticum TaxID=238834 RepID=UPI0013E9042E|nr:ABC transporter permease [Clostridium estertheticum]MBZ9689740.1 ABC transporter permease [Clostridium estertheticum]